MYTYHVYGNIYQEKYYFVNDYFNPYKAMHYDKWDVWNYPIYIYSNSEDIFNSIKIHNTGRNRSMGNRHINIDEYVYGKEPILLKRIGFTDTYKEIAVIETDIELRDDETIHIEGKDYNVKYVFNSDTNQHELYIDKIAETIVDKESLKHAKKVCNEVIKKIIRYNKEIDKQVNLKDRIVRKCKDSENNKIDNLESKNENISFIDKLKIKIRKLIEF